MLHTVDVGGLIVHLSNVQYSEVLDEVVVGLEEYAVGGVPIEAYSSLLLCGDVIPSGVLVAPAYYRFALPPRVSKLNQANQPAHILQLVCANDGVCVAQHDA